MHRHITRLALRSASRLALETASLTVGLTVIGGSAAAAQTAVAQSPSTQVQEIVVTAQRRSESLEKVPVAVQVVTGQALQAQNNNSLQDLGEILPAVHIVNNGSYANTLNVRGIGSGASNPAFDQSVATFDDDIYYGRSRMIQSSFLDIDRIEILKGPQSTFFGNNAVAGALNITTKKPDAHFDGYARALYGSYGTYAVEGAASLPVNDTFAVRLAGTTNGDNGWIRNVSTNKPAGGQQNYEGRLTALWKPVSDFDATLKIEAAANKIAGSASNTPGQFTECPPPTPLKTNAINKFCSSAIALGTPIGLDSNFDAGLPGQFADLQTNTEVLTLNYHKWGHTFTSVTGRYAYNYTSHQDLAGVGNTFLSTGNRPEDYAQFSQELRVASPANQPIEYLAGVYYQNDTTNILVNGNPAYLAPSVPFFVTAGFISRAQLAALTPLLPIGFDIGFHQKETVESAFASVSWNATSKLKFNAGLRGTSDQKDVVGSIAYGTATQTYGGFVPDPAAVQSSIGFLLGAPGVYPYSRTDKAWLGNLGVQYQLTPQDMLYATYNRGFKAGGYNAISPSPLMTLGGSLSPTFGPEFVNAYEAGLKSKWFDNRLLVNVDVFRENYAGLQVNSLVQLVANPTIAVTNAASSVSQGVEFETQWVASGNFRVSADVTYLDAHYAKYTNASPDYLQVQNKQLSQDLSGRSLDFAPQWSGSLTAEYTVNVADGFRLTADLSPFFQSKYYNSAGTDDPLALIKGNVRLDAKVTVDSPNRRWAVDLIGKNITNRVIPVSYGNSLTLGAKEEPVNVAIQLRFRW